jgi:RNA polymerase sigma-70 factor, ECF subfamily
LRYAVRREFREISVNTPQPPIVDTSEVALVDAAAAGDRDARRALFERYREPAYRVAYRVTGRIEDALDVVQDSFISAFENLGRFQRDAGFKTWLLRIATNRALDLLRSRKVRLAAPLDGSEDHPLEPAADGADELGGAVLQTLERAELRERLHRALESLPPDQRAVFALYAEGEMTYGQIAEVLGIPIGTVMSRLFHARRRLREILPDLAPAEEKPRRAS